MLNLVAITVTAPTTSTAHASRIMYLKLNTAKAGED